MMQGGFRLVAAGALMYVSGVYWETPRLKAKDVGGRIFTVLEKLNYGKSSKYQLAEAALNVARNLTKKWGQPNAAMDRNVAWGMLADAATFGEAVDFMVSQIKADYAVDTLRDLYAALKGNAPMRQQPKQVFGDLVAKALEKADPSDAEVISVVLHATERLSRDSLVLRLAGIMTRVQQTEPVQLAA
jgi:hypothetical protein